MFRLADHKSRLASQYSSTQIHIDNVGTVGVAYNPSKRVLEKLGDKSIPVLLPSSIQAHHLYVNIAITCEGKPYDHVSTWYLPVVSAFRSHCLARLVSMPPCVVKTSSNADETSVGIFPEAPLTYTYAPLESNFQTRAPCSRILLVT